MSVCVCVCVRDVGPAWTPIGTMCSVAQCKAMSFTKETVKNGPQNKHLDKCKVSTRL